MLPGRLGVRFALEALFLVLLAIGAGLADLRPALIAAVMAGAWVLVALVELAAERSARSPVSYLLPAPVEPEEDEEPERVFRPRPEERTVVAPPAAKPLVRASAQVEGSRAAARPSGGPVEGVSGEPGGSHAEAASPQQVGDAEPGGPPAEAASPEAEAEPEPAAEAESEPAPEVEAEPEPEPAQRGWFSRRRGRTKEPEPSVPETGRVEGLTAEPARSFGASTSEAEQEPDSPQRRWLRRRSEPVEEPEPVAALEETGELAPPAEKATEPPVRASRPVEGVSGEPGGSPGEETSGGWPEREPEEPLERPRRRWLGRRREPEVELPPTPPPRHVKLLPRRSSSEPSRAAQEITELFGADKPDQASTREESGG